jgi:hypothetical protein
LEGPVFEPELARTAAHAIFFVIGDAMSNAIRDALPAWLLYT